MFRLDSAVLELSNSQEAEFCVRAWERSLERGRGVPLISNTDQGSQFTSEAFLDAVESAGTEVSMDGREPRMDNRFIERLWRSVKHEDIYLEDYGDGLAAGRGLARWFAEYNHQRPHQALNYATPAEYYFQPDTHGAWSAAGRLGLKAPGTRCYRKRALRNGEGRGMTSVITFSSPNQ